MRVSSSRPSANGMAICVSQRDLEDFFRDFTIIILNEIVKCVTGINTALHRATRNPSPFDDGLATKNFWIARQILILCSQVGTSVGPFCTGNGVKIKQQAFTQVRHPERAPKAARCPKEPPQTLFEGLVRGNVRAVFKGCCIDYGFRGHMKHLTLDQIPRVLLLVHYAFFTRLLNLAEGNTCKTGGLVQSEIVDVCCRCLILSLRGKDVRSGALMSTLGRPHTVRN